MPVIINNMYSEKKMYLYNNMHVEPRIEAMITFFVDTTALLVIFYLMVINNFAFIWKFWRDCRPLN